MRTLPIGGDRIAKTTREELLHIYLAALVARLGGEVTLTFDELAATRYARMKHKRDDDGRSVTVTLEAE